MSGQCVRCSVCGYDILEKKAPPFKQLKTRSGSHGVSFAK